MELEALLDYFKSATPWPAVPLKVNKYLTTHNIQSFIDHCVERVTKKEQPIGLVWLHDLKDAMEKGKA